MHPVQFMAQTTYHKSVLTIGKNVGTSVLYGIEK